MPNVHKFTGGRLESDSAFCGMKEHSCGKLWQTGAIINLQSGISDHCYPCLKIIEHQFLGFAMLIYCSSPLQEFLKQYKVRNVEGSAGQPFQCSILVYARP